MPAARRKKSTRKTESKPPDLDVAETVRESAEATGTVSPERAQRFYDRMRERIHGYLQAQGQTAGKAGDFLLLVPDVFILLWRLVNDARVSGKNKIMLGSGIAYYIFPFDIMPEGLMGPVGFLDDLVFGVYILNKMLTDTDPEILREHWSGKEDLLRTIQRVLNSADTLVSRDIVGRFRNIFK